MYIAIETDICILEQINYFAPFEYTEAHIRLANQCHLEMGDHYQMQQTLIESKKNVNEHITHKLKVTILSKTEKYCKFEVRHGIRKIKHKITVMILNFQTDRSGQTVQTHIRLLLKFAIPFACF